MSNEVRKKRDVKKGIDEAVRTHVVTQDPIPREFRAVPEQKPKKE